MVKQLNEALDKPIGMFVDTIIASYDPETHQNGYFGIKLILIFLKITTSESTVSDDRAFNDTADILHLINYT